MSESRQHIAEAAPRQHGALRAVVAGSFGNIMEQYDNLVYGYSAVMLGAAFFPKSSALAGTLYSFAVFAVGFIVRPIGAVVFGHFGDKLGRRAALVVGVLMMGVSTTLIGVLPSYDSIGIVAPVLLVVLRLVQGFSVAGEWAGSAAYLVEYAPERRRGFYGSFNQVSTAAGFLLASAVVAANSAIFGEQQVADWAWRVPFLLSLITAIAATWLRFGLAETPAFEEEKQQGGTARSPLLDGLRTEFPAIARGFGFTMLWTVAYFFFLTYLPTYLTEVAKVDSGVAHTSNLVALAVLTVLIAVFGAVSDRIGRKRLLVVSSAGFLILSWPIMAWFHSGSTVGVYVGQIVITVILAMFSGPGPAALSEMYPTKLRYSTMSIGYNFAVMAFGGTAPFIATGLVGATSSDLSPALLPIVSAVVTLVALVGMRESAHRPLR
jgi:MHS family proline/betaine transporter-like MFS transporter